MKKKVLPENRKREIIWHKNRERKIRNWQERRTKITLSPLQSRDGILRNGFVGFLFDFNAALICVCI